MKIALKDIVLLFEEMQAELNISYVSIVVFVAVDVDSICTLKIFTRMFKCENIQFKVYPVTSYSQLTSRIEESKVYERVKMFMFINCGGLIDLTNYWIVQQQQAQIFLFDIHKPIHHKNLESPDIKIVDDGLSRYQACPTTEDLERYDQLLEYDLDSNQEDELEEEVEMVQDSPKRIKKRQFRERLRKHKTVIQDKISQYYGENFFGYPSSYSAYRMIQDLQKASNEYLWYAIVGATSMYLQQKISKEMLDTLMAAYRSQVGKFNVVGSKRGKGAISAKKGFQFTLLDHWSLYESMLNSNYMMIKLRLWEQRGLTKLKQFIHHLQISLTEAKQLFKYMPRESQVKLEDNIYSTAEKFKIHDVVYQSFVKQLDYSDSCMASDYHYILTSILQTPPKQAVSLEQLPEVRINSFWQAYDAFDSNMKQLLPRIESYKKTMKIMMNQTKNILERDHLISMSTVNIANVKSDTDDKKIFEHPSTLIRLAYILMGILRERSKKKTHVPFVANWIDMQKEIVMVVGVMTNSRNSIGNRFIEVAQKLNIQVNHDSFMANIIVIKKENLSAFMKEIGKKDSDK